MSLERVKFPDDLDRVAEVVVESFQYPDNPEWGLQSDEQQSIVEAISSLKRLWPLVRAISVVYPGLRDVLCGFFAIEGDRDAGLVLFQPMSPTGSAAWVIGTVAVMPSYRRRGLGNQLVTEALDSMRSKNAETVTLSVFSRNAPAYALYEAAGFSHYATSRELVRDADAPAPPAHRLPEGYALEPSPGSDWRRRFAFAEQITPSSVREYRPVIASNYRPPMLLRLFSTLMNRLSGQSERRYVMTRDDRGSSPSVVATAGAAGRTRSGGFNTISVQLDNDHGEIAPYLITRLTRELAESAPGRRLEFSVPDWNQPTIDAALANGFRERNVWHQMGMTLE